MLIHIREMLFTGVVAGQGLSAGGEGVGVGADGGADGDEGGGDNVSDLLHLVGVDYPLTFLDEGFTKQAAADNCDGRIKSYDLTGDMHVTAGNTFGRCISSRDSLDQGILVLMEQPHQPIMAVFAAHLSPSSRG